MTWSRPRLILFDLDGTLIDSAPDLAVAVNRTLAAFDRAPLPIAEVRQMVGDGAPKLVARALAARPGPSVEPPAALARFLDFYQAAATELTVLYPGVRETLAVLAEIPIALALCTNKPEGLSRRIVDALGIGGRFAGVVGGDTTPWKKPDPRMLTRLIDELGAAPAETLMVGDSEVDAAASAAAEVGFVLVTYGYRRGPAEAIACRAAIDRFDALQALVAGPARASAP
jgi:phosphoglycolate phosphatase